MTDSCLRTRWVRWYGAPRHARCDLICFPHAGAGASAYAEWLKHLPPGIVVCAIQLPGRESRLGELPQGTVMDHVRGLLDSGELDLSRPYLVYGHSFGATLGFEFCRDVRRRGGPLPLRLIVSGSRAPHLRPKVPPARLPDPELLAHIAANYGPLPDVLLADAELVAYVLNTLRADFLALERYAPAPEAPLPCGISALGGESDRLVSVDDLVAWRSHTSGPFDHRLFPGGHFFTRTNLPIIARALALWAQLEPWSC